jgi:integrase/recombinase XerD
MQPYPRAHIKNKVAFSIIYKNEKELTTMDYRLEIDTLPNDVKRWIGSFLSDRESKGLSPRTIENYKDILRRFHDYCVENGEGASLSTIRRQFIYDFLAWRTKRAKSFAQTSKNLYIVVIKGLFNYIADNNLEEANFSKTLRKIFVKLPKRLPKGLEEEECDRLERFLRSQNKKDHFLTIRNRLIVKMAFYSGIRRQEIVNLNIDDIAIVHLGEQEAYQLRVIGKGDKERLVFIAKYLIEEELELLRKYNVEGIAQTKSGRRLRACQVFRIVSNLLKNAGMKKRGVHTLRHTYAMRCIDRDVNIVTLQESLGHSSIQTTMIYARSNAKKKLEAAFRLSDAIAENRP